MNCLMVKRKETDSMKIIRTLVCPDGVIGLNGWQYLLDKDDNDMIFSSIDSANKFLLDEGCRQEWIDEWVEIVEDN